MSLARAPQVTDYKVQGKTLNYFTLTDLYVLVTRVQRGDRLSASALFYQMKYFSKDSCKIDSAVSVLREARASGRISCVDWC